MKIMILKSTLGEEEEEEEEEEPEGCSS